MDQFTNLLFITILFMEVVLDQLNIYGGTSERQMGC